MAIEPAPSEHNSRADVVADIIYLDTQQQSDYRNFKTYIEE